MYGFGMFLATNGIVNSGGSSYTTRTQAFKTATGITDTTILNALNTFDLGLISNGLDTKMTALYPFVGGTSTTHSYNFMNTAQYQLTFSGGWTHSSTGSLPNGTNAYANTGLAPTLAYSQNDAHFSFYSRTDSNYTSSFVIDMGVVSSPENGSWIETRYNNTTYFNINKSEPSVSVTDNDSLGMRLVSRLISTESILYKNGSLLTSGGGTSTGLADKPFYISARNENGTPDYYSNRQLAFATIGYGLNNTQQSNLYTLIQTFQTSLSRNV